MSRQPWYERDLVDIWSTTPADERGSKRSWSEGSKPEGMKLKQCELICLYLYENLPTDLLFNTHWTASGYELHLYSKPTKQLFVFNVNLNDNKVYKSDGSFFCDYPDLIRVLATAKITTPNDTSDDFFGSDVAPVENVAEGEGSGSLLANLIVNGGQNG